MALKSFSVKEFFTRGRKELEKLSRPRQRSSNQETETYRPTEAYKDRGVEEAPLVISAAFIYGPRGEEALTVVATVAFEPPCLWYTKTVCAPVREWMHELPEDPCNWVYHQLLYEESIREPSAIRITTSRSISERCKWSIAKRTAIREWIEELD
ncbi:hypothetical protein MMC14_001594 [Varicellaria rhodocarpa]|nr:hypothetical protein [Varicellaria rhodocarpa]